MSIPVSYGKRGEEFQDTFFMYDSSGNAVTGKTDSDFTCSSYKGTASSGLTHTVTEVAAGIYQVKFTPDDFGTFTYVVVSDDGYGRWDGILKVESIAGAVNDAGASTTSFVTNLTETGTDFWKDMALQFTSGALLGETRRVTAYNGTTKAVTVDALSAAPANSVTFRLVPIGSSATIPSTVDANVVQWRGSTPDTLVSGNVPADVQTWKGDVPSNIASGNVQTEVQAVAAGAITAGSIAAAAITSAKFGAGAIDAAAFAQDAADEIAARVRVNLATELGRLDVATSTRLPTSSYSAPPSAASIRAEVDANSTKLDVATSTRLAAVDYTTPPTAAAIAAYLLDTASTVEDKTLRETLRLMASVLLGEGLGTVAKPYKAMGGSAPRVAATTVSGERTSVTLTP